MKFLHPAIFASIFLALSSVFISPMASAAPVNPLADREDKIVPAVLLWMQQTGVKLTYLGNEGGIRGYLAESSNGNMNTVYVTPDGLHMVGGLLYSEQFADKEKGNVTGKQLSAMRKRYNDVADAVSAISLDDKISLPEALSKIIIERPEWDLPAFPAVEDTAPILNTLRSKGYQLTELGEEGGVRGYLSSFGKIKQAIYVTPDGDHFMMGVLYERGGRNVTGVQVGEMRARFDAAATPATPDKADDAASKAPAVAGATEGPSSSASKISDAAPSTTDATVAPQASAPTAPVAVQDAPVAAPAAQVSNDTSAKPEDHSQAEPTLPVPATPVAATSSPVALPAPVGPLLNADGNPSSRWYANLDKATFYDAVSKATWFDVGPATAPTTLYMVADPNCPWCHQTWDYIKSYVADQQVRVRVIMIAFLPGSDAKAREILMSPRPGIAYLETDAGRNVKFQADQKSPQWNVMAGHLLNNRKFTEKFHIDRTPFLAYEDKNGQLYASIGVPENSNFDAFFAAAHLKQK